jgi:hypothetical protein
MLILKSNSDVIPLNLVQPIYPPDNIASNM